MPKKNFIFTQFRKSIYHNHLDYISPNDTDTYPHSLVKGSTYFSIRQINAPILHISTIFCHISDTITKIISTFVHYEYFQASFSTPTHTNGCRMWRWLYRKQER